MKEKYFLYESIIKSTNFYQNLLESKSRIKMFHFRDKTLLYEYNENNTLKYTYFIHFKYLPFYKYMVTIYRDGKAFTEELHYINYPIIKNKDKVKKKSFIKFR